MAEPRRPALDDEKKKIVIRILRKGHSRRRAAEFVGCSPTTIRRAALRDPAFAESIAKAESESEILCLNSVKEAGMEKRYWRAAAWLLERRYPEDYAARPPATVPMSQLPDLVQEIADLLMDETMDLEVRKRIRRRVTALGRSMCVAAGAESE